MVGSDNKRDDQPAKRPNRFAVLWWTSLTTAGVIALFVGRLLGMI